MDDKNITGGCDCGAIRYEMTGEPEAAFACYCETCQKQASAPMILYFIAHTKDGFMLTGEPVAYKPSANGARYKCGKCGTFMYFQYDAEPGKFVVGQGTLDKPNSLAPEAHIFTSEAPKWHEIGGDAPQFAQYPPA